MNESVFRKQSLDRISSPDQIDDYMKVTNPGMWLVIGAIILLLLAAVCWSITGRIETTITAEGQAQNGQVTVQLAEDQMDGVEVGTEVRAEGKTGEVTEILEQEDSYLVVASLPETEEGTVNVSIVTERIAPITFVTE